MNKIPTALNKALGANPKAKTQWESLTPIARRDFVSWINSAKQEETKLRRIEVACSKLSAGKRRPCCYALVPMNLYKALGNNPKAKFHWKSITPDERRDFIQWIDEGKKSRNAQTTNQKSLRHACRQKATLDKIITEYQKRKQLYEHAGKFS